MMGGGAIRQPPSALIIGVVHIIVISLVGLRRAQKSLRRSLASRRHMRVLARATAETAQGVRRAQGVGE